MPLYEYQCTACGKLTEKRQKFSDPELTECPHCGGRLERTITAPAVQFKGGGWYADLYSSGKKPSAANASSEGAGKSGDSGKGETASKPAENSSPTSAPASAGNSGSSGSSAAPSSAPAPTK